MPPSERAADLALNVRRIKRETGLKTVPILVVEGETDIAAFGALLCHGEQQAFPAGTRQLVEELLVHLKSEAPDGYACVYLTDCDGVGKTARLASESDLIVTEACDLEADLIQIGVAHRLIRRFCASEERAAELVEAARDMSLPLSRVRRAAHKASVGMKKRGKMLRLAQLPELTLNSWEETTPALKDVIEAVASELGWEPRQTASVTAGLADVPKEFDRCAHGKDTLDALYRLASQRADGEIRGWSASFFYRSIFAELRTTDLTSWVVGRRLRKWEATTGHELLTSQ